MNADDEIIHRFEDHTLPPASFRHREHLLVAWTYLRALPFAEAAARFATNVRGFAEAHGAGAKYHETVTWAYAALLHERMHASRELGFDELLAKNADLLDHEGGALRAHYDSATLSADLARTVFVLPRPRRGVRHGGVSIAGPRRTDGMRSKPTRSALRAGRAHRCRRLHTGMAGDGIVARLMTEHPSGAPARNESDERALSKEERRLALLLGVPSAGLSVCLTVLSTYLPVLARRFTSSTAVIGSLVGGEGLIAVLLPVWVGALSDRTSTRFGRRLPFLIASAPVAALALCLVPFARSLLVMAAEVFLFYVAYFTYFSPYRALYPDLVPESESGRAQGVQGVFNGAGMGLALVGGGLLDLWQPLPYLLAAGVLVVATTILVIGMRGGRKPLDRDLSSSVGVWTLLRRHSDIRAFVLGNALLTLGLGGLKSFVVLWLTEGLGKSMQFTAGAMMVVAVGSVVGALLSGKLADKFGVARVLGIALAGFGVGLAVGTFSKSVAVLGTAFPVIALCGGAAIALPYALLMRLSPSRSHGTVAGLFDVSSGLGTLLGPTLTGVAIDLLRPFFGSTHGYAAMWPVLSVSVLASAVLLWRASALERSARRAVVAPCAVRDRASLSAPPSTPAASPGSSSARSPTDRRRSARSSTRARAWPRDERADRGLR